MDQSCHVRPRFTPSSCDCPQTILPLISTSTLQGDQWIPIVSCPADFPLELFEQAIEQFIHHPEYNSTLILRSEIVRKTFYSRDMTSDLDSHRPIRNIHRTLLPRRPGRDAPIDQLCTLYGSTSGAHMDVPCTLVLSPLLPPGASLPYYHPAVRHLAFRFISSTPPILRIEAVLLPDTLSDINSRLYRTALSLLETLHRYGWGAMTHYQKRVMHDCVIPRETYQNLYLVMRERYKHLVSEWKESTDPLKHVFEDIGIATYLILLWEQTYFQGTEGHNLTPAHVAHRDLSQPPGGFLDLGCGNGLLTHILLSEGYHGHGIDLRARTSWSHYSEHTRAALHVHALDPTQYVRGVTDNGSKPSAVPYLQPGAFLIGNHADELTPWLPVIATMEYASGYLSIPCCAWSFDDRFSRSSTVHIVDLPAIADDETLADRLNLGREGSHQSQYSVYRIWLAKLSQSMGWKVECDTLRIPSTRNWAIIGRCRRERIGDDTQFYVDRALGIVQEVVKRGTFKTRTPEGKAGDQ
ncbi:hypothetical protein JVU11DRAFT_7703 [Chiua virens]|nr:hypothetical protein JVU11DRAFT_7703 [Chiua virens]